MARKVNTRFLLITIVVIGVVGGAAAVAYKKGWLFRKDPRSYIAKGDQLMNEGDYEKAARFYGTAGVVGKDPAMYVKAGDVFNKLTYADQENLKNAYTFWNGALSVDPTYIPALQRLLSLQWDLLEQSNERPQPQRLEEARSTAEKLLRADPDNRQARATLPIVTLLGWMSGVETENDKIEQAVQALVDEQPKQPQNADIPFFIARARLEQARRVRSDDMAGTQRLVDDATNVMESAVKTQDDNALMHWRAGQLYSRAGVLLMERQAGATTAPTTSGSDSLADATGPATRPSNPLIVRGRTEFARARELVKPEDPHYVDINLYAADALSSAGDAAGAEKVYRDLIQQKPTELLPRRQLAQILKYTPKRRQEAIDLLSAPLVPTPEQRAGIAGLTLKEQELTAQADLADIRIDQYSASNDPAQKAELLKQIEDTAANINRQAPDSPILLRLRGRLLMVQGDNVAALQTLTRAFNALPPGDTSQRYDLIYLLAQANLNAGQTGQAKLLLQQLIDRTGYLPARQQLVSLLIRDNDLPAAREQLKILMKQRPDSPDLKALSMITLDPKTQKPQIQALFAQLPETTRTDKVTKARMAIATEQYDQMQRLLEAVLAENPGDVEAAGVLAEVLANQQKDTAQALAVLDRALQKNPNDPRLTMLRERIVSPNTPPVQSTDAAIAKLPPLQQELALGDQARAGGKVEEAQQHFLKATQLDAKNVDALTALFGIALQRKQFDVAQGYLDRLAAPEVNGDHVGGTLFRWQMAMAKGDQKAALDLATTLTRENGMFGQSWLALAKTQLQLGRYEEAIANFQQARDRQPQNLETWQGLIVCAEALSRFNDSKQYIEQAQKMFRNDPTFPEMALNWEMNHGDVTKVLSARQDAVKAAPDKASNWLRLAVTQMSAGEKAGFAKDNDKANQYYAQARDTYTQGAEKFPDDFRFVGGSVVASSLLKDQAAGEKMLAIAASRPGLKDRPEVVSLSAEFYNRMGKPDQAVKALNDFLAKPEFAKAGPEVVVPLRIQLADLLLRDKKYDDALKALGDDKDPRLVLRRFDVLMSADRVADAEKLVTDVLASGNLGVNTTTFQGALAMTYLRSGRAKEALDLLNKVVAADPKSPGGLLYRARAMLSLPNPDMDQVAKDLTTVREVEPENLDARYLLAEVQRRRNDPDTAVRELEDIIRTHPDEKKARLQLMDLYANSTPPRWVDAERVARDAAAVPSLANDPDVLVAEANMWRTKGEPKRAIQRLDEARKAGATDAVVFQTLFSVLIEAKAYPMVMQVTDGVPPATKDQWWVHQARGRARAGMGDMQGATQEFEQAMQQLTAAKDDAHAGELVQQMSTAVGIDAALKQIEKRVAGGNPGWVITAAQLHERKNDLPTARKMIDDLLSKSDKLSPLQKSLALNYAGHAWITDPGADMSKAKDAYLQLVQLKPDDYVAWNNLACIKGLSPEQSLKYSQNAYDKMQKANVNEPYVLDTHGWNLVQAGRNDEGLGVLMTAWGNKQFPELAYHLGVVNKNKALADHNPALLVESEKYLTQAGDLFGKAVEKHEVSDLHLGDDIAVALREVRDLRSKQAAQAN